MKELKDNWKQFDKELKKKSEKQWKIMKNKGKQWKNNLKNNWKQFEEKV